jgi:hypothetical protein
MSLVNVLGLIFVPLLVCSKLLSTFSQIHALMRFSREFSGDLINLLGCEDIIPYL